MKSLRWGRARPKTIASIAGVTVAAVAITGMALAYEGNPTAEVDLHDGGVWITKSSSMLVGHFNNESRVLDGGLRAAGDQYDVLQDGGTVLVSDTSASTLTAVDPARVAMEQSVPVPGGAKIALGGTTVAMLEPKDGKLWAVQAGGLGGFKAGGAKPVATLGKGADVAVGQDGTVYGVSAEDGTVVTVAMSPQGEAEKPSSAPIELPEGAEPRITVVGTRPVVLDAASGALRGPGIETEIEDADGAVLQWPSADAPGVTIATSKSLVTVPFDGAEPVVREAGGEGAPAVPAVVKGCAYGAWAGSARFVRDCAGDAADLEAGIEGAEGSTSLTFRVNRDVVVLNDIIGGAAWLAADSLQRVDNWEVITPPEGESEDNQETSEETVETTLPERSEQNTPPIATDDEFGVRPGRTTLLPVLDNDTDADGDVLVAALEGDQPGLGRVEPINNGGALQIAVPEDATGGGSFRYGIDDGRGGTAQANVQLSVHDWSVNAAPTQKRTTSLAVETGGTVSYNVLPDWIDPDGDDVYLKSVTAAEGDEVDFTTDGQITYRAVASLQGRKDIEVVVADGQNESAVGVLRLDVRPAGSTMPKTNADHVVTRAGESVTVAPLTNDTSSGREALRLARVDEVSGATITPDFPNKTFTFQAEAPGVYYAQYLVSAGPNAVPGLVRVDVLDKTQEDLPPVAVRDVALLPTGGDVLVGVLNNDTEPSGGILVVQSVTVPPQSGISVSVLNHETLRITDQGMLDEQVRISYRISNGTKTAEGDVIVIPIPAPDKLLPPVANDDQVVVRAGDVVNIPVLDNDTHPNGDALHLAPDLVEPLVDPLDGEAFVSQDLLRFRAGPEAKTVYATYEAIDTTGQKDAGYVTIQILPLDAEENAAPRPQDITVRALSGSSVRVAVPLDGLDADGDSVELLGLASAPKKGEVSEVGTNYLVYDAFADSVGADTFTYRVRDRLGKEGTASIRVGIAPGTETNQAPYAVKDSIVTRPGRTVAVPVLANDSDPEGDAIGLVTDGVEVPDVAGLSAEVSGDRLLVTAPDSPMETSVQYTIADERGAEATAPLQITVAEDVPLVAPIARDDRVLVEDVTDDLTVDVAVLDNDEDPDGVVDDLELEVEDGGVIRSDRSIRVTVGEERQLIRYTVTDLDDQQASAFIFVPARDELRPTLRSTKPVEVKSGERIDLPLSEYVTVAGGGTARITEAAKVSAVNSDGSSLIKDEATLTYASKNRYFGRDALTFEVTDGTGPDDPEGRKATLTIPITVLPPDNQPPTFTNGEVTVAPGEQPVTVDLAALTDDPDPEDKSGMAYAVAGQPRGGITARIEGSTLSVEAGSTVPKGTTGTVRIRVDDGTTDPIEGTVAVTVSASTRPLPVANEDTVPQADQGKEISIPVLANDVNPFPETPLAVTSAIAETGSGTVRRDGDNVVVQPSEDYVGPMVVRYRIQDATKDPDREVDGRIVITVQGVPDAPSTPRVTSVQDRTAVLSWSPPANNGAEITGYTVTSLAGNYTKACTSTTCTLDGLTNNVEYTFQVVATNRVGDSEPSRASEVARPDARPDTPTPPTLKFGDKSLSIAWKTPTTPGSPVSSYTLEISPAPPNGVATKTGVTGNAYTWEGLENGASYQVRVRAHNRAPEPSSWSGWSADEIPAGPPGAPGVPRVGRSSAVGDQAQVNVSWPAASPNGDPVAEYRLHVLQGGTTVQELLVSGTEQAVVVPTSTTDYTFRVQARNKAGWGALGEVSPPVRAVTKPKPITDIGVEPHDKSITVTYQKHGGNGFAESEISVMYSLDGGIPTALVNDTITGLTNGTTYRVTLFATVNDAAIAQGSFGGDSGYYYQSDPATSGEVVPFGPVNTPSATAENLGTSIRLGWNAPPDNGRTIQVMQISIDGGAWENVGRSGTRDVGNGYQQTHSIAVKAMDTEGQWSQEATRSATTSDPPPPPTATLSRAPGVSKEDARICGHSSCGYYVVNTKNFTPGTYRITCMVNGSMMGGNHRPRDYYLPANGPTQLSCFQGYPGSQASVVIDGWGETPAITWPNS
ncbi:MULTISPECIES: Ig-like domain-containing protein [unclassified Microbacterium]|uniref:Ig-like domain-containing protein n=1 Tax=unclassified Microbacterium TaxID=2609290 RepID=UPI0030104D6E